LLGLPWVLTVCWLPVWRLRLLRLHTLLTEPWRKRRRLLHRLYALVSLRIETWVYSWLCIGKLLCAALERSVLRLLPCWDIWRRGNVNTRRRISIRRHVCLHSMSGQRRRYVCRLLLVWAYDRGRHLATRLNIWVRAQLTRPAYRSRSPSLCRWEV
jgi:hypothetical protein